MVLAGLLAAAAGTVLGVAVNAATGSTVSWFPSVDRFRCGGLPADFGCGLRRSAGVVGSGRYGRALRELVPAVQRPELWVVDRPSEVNQIVAALLCGGDGGDHHGGARDGRFRQDYRGEIVRADPRMQRRFRYRVFWVTVGRDATTQLLAGLVNDLLVQLEPGRPVTFTHASQAGEHLAAVLGSGPRRLLVLDDVWTEEQLAVFPVVGRCARLVTTRNLSLTRRCRDAA